MLTARPTIWILLVLWMLAMVLSVLSLMAEPTGDSFLRGLNRITGFLGWQLAAAVAALLLWIGVRPLPRGDMVRWLGRLPGWWAVLVLLLFVGMITIGVVSSNMGRQAIVPEDPGPVTAPLDPPQASN